MEAILHKGIVMNRSVLKLAGVAFFVLCIALGAFIRIPVPGTPVPLTLQTFFVLLSAAFLARRLSLVTVIGYMVLGASGVSLFAGSGSGMVYLIGPTGGYLVGFLAAAVFIGTFVKRAQDRLLPLFFIFFCGSLIILCAGSLWLKVLLNVSLNQAVLFGFFPFVAGEVIKAYSAAIIYTQYQSRFKKYSS